MKYILVLCGMSASGKDTILKMLDPLFERLVSHTTRPQRPNEVNGYDYHFVTKDDFIPMFLQGEIIEDRIYNTIQDGKPATWYYGLHKNELRKSANDYMVILDYQGTKQLINEVDENTKVIVAYIDASDEKRLERVTKRGVEIAEFERREIADKASFEGCKEFANIVVDNNEDEKIREQVIRMVAKYYKWRKIYA